VECKGLVKLPVKVEESLDGIRIHAPHYSSLVKGLSLRVSPLRSAHFFLEETGKVCHCERYLRSNLPHGDGFALVGKERFLAMTRPVS
jgi:hypothetical protein